MLSVATKVTLLKNRVWSRYEGSPEKQTKVESSIARVGKLGPMGQIRPTACFYR